MGFRSSVFVTAAPPLKARYNIRIASGAVSFDRNRAIDFRASSWVRIFLTVSGGARRARTAISLGRGSFTPAGLRALRSGLIGNLLGSGILCWPILSSDWLALVFSSVLICASWTVDITFRKR